ncbi:MAG: ATP-binding protein [Flavipsychrobacter sp.]|nr:ATP-binding protein [Flavipsychrobacter sp.]
MNQALLTRLFKSIEGNESSALVRVAYSIIEEEKKKGHNGVAERLNTILKNNLADNSSSLRPALKVTRITNFKVPLDRRYKLPLASHIEHEGLRHNMILPTDVEDKILRIEKEYFARERLAHHGLRPRKKVLFYGSSGCGKSMAAEKIAWDLALPFYKVRFDTIISSYLGESASNLQRLFESINEFPCVLLLDEFDIIGKQRNIAANDVGEVHRIVNILLGLLEEYNGEGIIIATTNLDGVIDKALFRRFDDFIELPKPTQKEIADLLKLTFSALQLDLKIDLPDFAKAMHGMSYAIVVKVANDAAKKAVINSKDKIELEDLKKSLAENAELNK